MADTSAPSGTQSPLFSMLAARYGVRGALALLPLLDPNASKKAKAFGGASLAGSGAQAAGNLTGNAGLAAAGKAAGTGLGLASAGYGIYNAATDPNLSKTQQVGHSGRGVADAIMSLFIPYYGLARGVNVVGQGLQRSGSPQVRGTGRALDQATEPAGAKAFWSVAQGDMSPKAALSKAGPEGLVTDLLGPLGAALKGAGIDRKVARNVMDFGPIPGGGKLAGLLGIGSKPTTGTQFRDQIRSLFDQSPALKGTDTSKYNMEGGVDAYNAFSPQVRSQAEALARQLGPLSPIFAKQDAARQQAYVGQIANILLNRFGSAGIPGLKL